MRWGRHRRKRPLKAEDYLRLSMLFLSMTILLVWSQPKEQGLGALLADNSGVHPMAPALSSIRIESPEKIASPQIEIIRKIYQSSEFLQKSDVLNGDGAARAEMSRIPDGPPVFPQQSAPPAQPPLSLEPPVSFENSVTYWFGSIFPVVMRELEEELVRHVQMVGEKEVRRSFSEGELQSIFERLRERRLKNVVSSMKVNLYDRGVLSEAQVHWGPATFSLICLVNVVLREGRPYVRFDHLHVGDFEIPQPVVRWIENDVNERMKQERLPLEISDFRVGNGWVAVSAELH